MLALCLRNHKGEHIAPIMFPPFPLDPVGFGVVGPMGPFFSPVSTEEQNHISFCIWHFAFIIFHFGGMFPYNATLASAMTNAQYEMLYERFDYLTLLLLESHRI
jgi:hypothetical protein